MQSRTWKYLIAGAGLVATAACADDQPATKVTMPNRPSLIISTACDFTKIKKDTKGYVVAANDPIYGRINDLASLNRGTDGLAFNAKAYDILAYIGSIAGTSAVTANTAAGDALINDIFACLSITTTAGQFTNALGANGLFAVRANVSDFVLSRGTPKYGAQPATDETWKSSVPADLLPPGLQLVVYGYPRNVNTFTGEAALTVGNPPVALTGYELFTVPAVSTFAKSIIAGVCLDGTIPSNAGLLHEHGGQDVILNRVTPPFCSQVLGMQAPNENRGMFALVRRVSDWIAPKPLYAATMVLGGMGGSLGGLSPIGPVTVNGGTVTLTGTQQPTTGTINTNFVPPIQVSAATAGGTPLGGVLVTLSVIGNQGSPIVLKDSTATTGNDGVATFTSFQTNKAGGYLFKASGTFGGVPTKADTTAMINVAGQ
jgi:hypothetical protein